jgi:short chain dehydrogenase
MCLEEGKRRSVPRVPWSSCLRVKPREDVLQRMGRKTQRDFSLRHVGPQQPQLDDVVQHTPRGALRKTGDASSLTVFEFPADQRLLQQPHRLQARDWADSAAATGESGGSGWDRTTSRFGRIPTHHRGGDCRGRRSRGVFLVRGGEGFGAEECGRGGDGRVIGSRSATAKWLSERGARVSILDRTTAAGSASACHFAQVDVTDGASVAAGLAAAEAACGAARILVNCAGVAPAARIVSAAGAPHPLDLFRQVIEVNLLGTFNVMAQFAARLARQDLLGEERGVIVSTASGAAFEGQRVCPIGFRRPCWPRRPFRGAPDGPMSLRSSSRPSFATRC